MLWCEAISLIAITETTNAIGDRIPSETKSSVYANRKSIRQSEFYQAQAAGLQPEIMFEVRSADYAGQKLAETSDGARYKVIRTYDKNMEITELVCQGLVI